ncbi:hypothetical protein KR51_00036770 [Rubidibacter lacunae KORDI 51-2]|uniref:Uncharacterized protein n=1 Tax=Rubidibacter lacunae KORDI 51-2 TaxID=582515 RepID=U5DH59_9CHRO|nr:hypothetical protein KR51_00036770 [Rubidibacter lacunae KORDI 51-2]
MALLTSQIDVNKGLAKIASIFLVCQNLMALFETMIFLETKVLSFAKSALVSYQKLYVSKGRSE